MQKIVYLYTLRKGVSIQDYEHFSDLDQAITPKQPGVLKFEVLEIKGSNKDPVPYQIMEVIDVESFAQWRKVQQSPAMAPLGDGFKKCVEESSVSMVYGDIIPPPETK